jgi:hypothetical protein
MRHQSLFEPDVLIAELSGATRRNSAAQSSEKRLMLAVLQNAFDCYQKYLHANDAAGRELFEEAAAWIRSTNREGLFSFENISEALDIEAEYFRRGLAEWHNRQLDSQRSAAPPPAPPPRAARRAATPAGS